MPEDYVTRQEFNELKKAFEDAIDIINDKLIPAHNKTVIIIGDMQREASKAA